MLGRLLDKSTEAYVLALETINRLSIQYRVETFSYLICNAWELLLKGRLLQQTGKRSSIYYKKVRNQRRMTLALRDCLKAVIPNEKDATRLNLERVADLRDDAVHLVIRAVPKDIMGLFQACVLNYHRLLGEWFGMSLSDRVPVGMMALVYDLNPEQFDLQNPVLRRRLGRESAKYLGEFEARIRRDFEDLGKPAEFCIGIEYKLALTEKPAAADIVLTKGSGGAGFCVVEVPKDPSKTHPLRQKDVLTKVNLALPAGSRINQFDVQCVNRIHSIKKRSEFFYQGTVPGSPAQYSDKYVTWLVQQVKNDSAFFAKARQRYKQLGRESTKPKASA
ncbi:MAG: hypothetical protein AMXMBFR83_25820 [Phycisphaerae bacterium]